MTETIRIGPSTPKDHDHTGDAGDGGLLSAASLSGTPGGELGGTWASPTVDSVHSGSAHHSQSHDHSAAGDGQTVSPVTLNIPSSAHRLGKNEFYWPPPVAVGDALDLDAAAQWWRKVGTPTGGIPYTTATAASIATTYGEDLIKCVAAASGDGLQTTWTYANEKRVKSGSYMAILVAVYLVTAARTVTISLSTSTPTTIASDTVTTTGSWQLKALESSTALDGTTATFKATLDGAGTFYVIPLGAIISPTASPKAVGLAHRGMAFRWTAPASVKSLTGLGDEATWTDVDLTSAATALAVLAQLNAYLYDTADCFRLSFRRNGSSDSASADGPNEMVITLDGVGGNIMHNNVVIPLDDSQIFEYHLDRTGGSSTVNGGGISLTGWWEWA